MSDLRINAFDTNAPIGNVTQHPVNDNLLSIGFVVASPSSGLVKAILPDLGLYSDIRIEDLSPIFSEPTVIVAENPPEPLDMDREELKAHLEAQDLRVDARLKSFEQTVKDAMGEIRLEMSNLGGDLKAVERDLGHLKDLKSSMRNTSLGIVSAIIGSAIAIYFGIQSSNSSLVSSTISGFGVGKDMATAQAAMTQQTKDTQEILRQVQEQQKQIQESLRVKNQSPPPAANSKK